MTVLDFYKKRRESARQRVDEAFRVNMALLPVEAQAILESLPDEAAKYQVKIEILRMMETSDKEVLQHSFVFLAGMLMYAHRLGHLDKRSLATLSDLRISLRSGLYVSKGPFVTRPLNT